MAGLLLSGPAGAGKSREARRLLVELPAAVLIDFQSLYAAILGLTRDTETGRYPERDDRHRYGLGNG